MKFLLMLLVTVLVGCLLTSLSSACNHVNIVVRSEILLEHLNPKYVQTLF